MKAIVTSLVTAGALFCGANAFADGPRGGIQWNHDAGARGDFHGDRGFRDVDYRRHDYHRDGPRTFFSFSIGAPPLFWRPYAYSPWYGGYGYPYYGYPYYDYPRTVVIQRQPEVYIQQAPAAAAPQAPSSGYWYYCPDSRMYYPYAQTCPSNWMTVVPPASAPGQ